MIRGGDHADTCFRDDLLHRPGKRARPPGAAARDGRFGRRRRPYPARRAASLHAPAGRLSAHIAHHRDARLPGTRLPGLSGGGRPQRLPHRRQSAGPRPRKRRDARRRPAGGLGQQGDDGFRRGPPGGKAARLAALSLSFPLRPDGPVALRPQCVARLRPPRARPRGLHPHGERFRRRRRCAARQLHLFAHPAPPRHPCQSRRDSRHRRRAERAVDRHPADPAKRLQRGLREPVPSRHQRLAALERGEGHDHRRGWRRPSAGQPARRCRCRRGDAQPPLADRRHHADRPPRPPATGGDRAGLRHRRGRLRIRDQLPRPALPGAQGLRYGGARPPYPRLLPNPFFWASGRPASPNRCFRGFGSAISSRPRRSSARRGPCAR